LLAGRRKQQFKSLPYDLQVYVAAHETQREKALRARRTRLPAPNGSSRFRNNRLFQQMTRKHRKPKPMSMTRTLPLEERIKQLPAEIDVIIDARAEAVARQSPGVPLEVIRDLLTARPGLPLRPVSGSCRQRCGIEDRG
jgi:hypothetical protein